MHNVEFGNTKLKHGTIALIENGTPCIVFTTENTNREIIANASELKARGAYIIGVGPENNSLFDFYIN